MKKKKTLHNDQNLGVAAGYVHDLVALRGVRPGSVGLQGRPTTDCSWFRGYAWTIAVCAHCSMHLVRASQSSCRNEILGFLINGNGEYLNRSLPQHFDVHKMFQLYQAKCLLFYK